MLWSNETPGNSNNSCKTQVWGCLSWIFGVSTPLLTNESVCAILGGSFGLSDVSCWIFRSIWIFSLIDLAGMPRKAAVGMPTWNVASMEWHSPTHISQYRQSLKTGLVTCGITADKEKLSIWIRSYQQAKIHQVSMAEQSEAASHIFKQIPLETGHLPHGYLWTGQEYVHAGGTITEYGDFAATILQTPEGGTPLSATLCPRG